MNKFWVSCLAEIWVHIRLWFTSHLSLYSTGFTAMKRKEVGFEEKGPENKKLKIDDSEWRCDCFSPFVWTSYSLSCLNLRQLCEKTKVSEIVGSRKLIVGHEGEKMKDVLEVISLFFTFSLIRIQKLNSHNLLSVPVIDKQRKFLGFVDGKRL